MAEHLNIKVGNDIAKKMVEKKQKNEYQRISNYKEGYCFGCFSKDAVGATIVDICEDCLEKKGKEPLLAVITASINGLCWFCKAYKMNTKQINVRACRSCERRFKEVHKWFRAQGGMFGADPFWKRIRNKYGKDWKILWSQPERTRI